MPALMRERKQWLLWRLEEVEGRDGLQKVPYYINGRKRFGDLGGDADLRALATFDDALNRLSGAMHFTGLGFAFLENDGLVGIDLDHMFDQEGGEIRDHHQAIVEACQSYTERSFSGHGLHIIALGRTDSFKHDPCGVEVYCGGRYFTCTGQHYSGTPDDVRELKPYALAYMREVVQRSKDAVRASKEAAQPVAAAPMQRVQSPGQGGNNFKRVNDAAYANLDAWVPQIFPKATRKAYGWRVTSKALGRDLQEDLQLSNEGINDFGEERGMSPIDVVMKWQPACSTALAALQWLAPIVGVQLESKRPLQLVKPAQQDPRPEPPPPPLDEGAAAEGATPRKGGKVSKKSPDAPDKGGGGVVERLLESFALIYGTDQVWDGEKRVTMAVKNLRLIFGSALVNTWLAHPDRRLLMQSQLVFEPGVEVGEGCVNLFDGLAMEPIVCTEDECKPILELLRHLCSLSAAAPEGVDKIMHQVMCWLALPLQKVGAKLRFALVFHGPQGTGKNLFFDAVRSIYGKYGKMVGQTELEDRFNGYLSGKLMLIGNEVVTRQELFHNKNKLKWVITEAEIPIRGMHQEVRWESNHANIVFLSNELQPVALERDDRRHLVIYTPAANDEDLYLRVSDFLARDGAAKFLHFLQRYDTDGFNEFTKPMMTEAKATLIELGLKPAERFVNEWLQGLLALNVQVCSAEQLYRVFRRWGDMNGERFTPPQATFTETVKKHVFEYFERDETGQRLEPRLSYKVVNLKHENGARKAMRCWLPRGTGPLPGVSEGEWAAAAVEGFEREVARFGRHSSEDEA